MLLILFTSLYRLVRWAWMYFVAFLSASSSSSSSVSKGKKPKHVALLCDRSSRPEDIEHFVNHFHSLCETISVYAFEKSQIVGNAEKKSHCFLWYEGQSKFLEGGKPFPDLDLVVVHKPVMNIAGIDPLRIKLAEFFRLDYIDPVTLNYALYKYSKTEQRYGK